MNLKSDIKLNLFENYFTKNYLFKCFYKLSFFLFLKNKNCLTGKKSFVFILILLFLQVDDKSFNAHRVVLAATIPYFNAMFLSNMAESKQKEVTLHGLDSM